LNALQLSKDHTTSNDQVEREPWFFFLCILALNLCTTGTSFGNGLHCGGIPLWTNIVLLWYV
jgi:hypothetical protein